MDTTVETELQSTSATTVPMQNGYSNGISNCVSQEEEKGALETKTEMKSSVTSSLLKSTGNAPLQGSMLRKDVFYPYQKSMYMSPSYNLSSDSKRMIRRLQEPIFAASPGTIHLVYEVGGLMAEILLKLSLFFYASSGMLPANSLLLLNRIFKINYLVILFALIAN